MSGARKLQIAILAMLGSILVGWIIFHESEPIYNGKPLSVWSEEFTAVPFRPQDLDTNSEAAAAIRAIGPAAIPFLGKEFNASLTVGSEEI